jgi:hypothetical protein
MQNTINAVTANFMQTEIGRELLNDFLRMRTDKGWKFMQLFIVELGNHLANEVLGRRFQELEDKKKLVRLEAYSDISILLKFLASPSETFERVATIKEHNRQMGQLRRPKAKQTVKS